MTDSPTHSSAGTEAVDHSCECSRCAELQAIVEDLREELASAKAQVTIALRSNGFQLLGEPQRAPRRDPMLAAIASLAAAISLLERMPKAKKAAPSDKMFDQMLDDYRKALANARDAIAEVRG